MASATRVVGLALGLVGPAHGWYLPGVAPHDFQRGERVELKVNKLTSTRTQVRAARSRTTRLKPAAPHI